MKGRVFRWLLLRQEFFQFNLRKLIMDVGMFRISFGSWDFFSCLFEVRVVLLVQSFILFVLFLGVVWDFYIVILYFYKYFLRKFLDILGVLFILLFYGNNCFFVQGFCYKVVQVWIIGDSFIVLFFFVSFQCLIL